MIILLLLGDQNPQKNPVDPHLDQGKRHPDLHKLHKRQRLPPGLGLLDDDHVACGAEDREVAGDRAPGGERHEVCGRSPGLHLRHLYDFHTDAAGGCCVRGVSRQLPGAYRQSSQGETI